MDIPEFIASLQDDTYPEKPSQLHDDITRMSMDWVLPHVEGKQVLDVGCGQGVALAEFARRGYNAVGTGVNQSDLEACQEKGFAVVKADMHDNGAKTKFDLIWMRHVLEHSPIPLYVLTMMRQRLNQHGILYVEVPAPDTSAHHESNPNHYSVFTAGAWAALFHKVGLDVVEFRTINLKLQCGEDAYLSFICRPHQQPSPALNAGQPSSQTITA